MQKQTPPNFAHDRELENKTYSLPIPVFQNTALLREDAGADACSTVVLRTTRHRPRPSSLASAFEGSSQSFN